MKPFTLIFKSCPAGILVKFFLAAVNGAVLPLTVMLVQRLIDSATTGVSASFLFIVPLGGVFFVELICANADTVLALWIKNKINFRFKNEIFNKYGRIPYQLFEASDVNKNARQILEKHVSAADSFIGWITFCVRLTVTFLGLFSFLAMIQWWILALILLTMTPVFFLSVVTTIKEYDTFSTYFPFVLKAQYLSRLITQRRYIKEARLFQYLKFVEAAWEAYLQKFHGAQIKSNLKPRFLTGFCVILQYTVTVLNLFILYPKTTNYSLSIGMFVAIAQAVWSFVGGFQYELIGMIRNRQNYNLFAKDYTLFMKTPETPVEEPDPELTRGPPFSKITLENIWFRYTEDGPYILRGIDLEIHNGHKIGIVGENGSGKSTLIKILLGLLVPDKGRIMIDNELIDNNNRYRLRRMMSAVFQDYTRFNFTLKESVSLNNPGGIKDTEKMKKILNSLHRDNNFFASFEKGMDTPLGKDIWEGRGLSGGEWQTVTLARSLFSGRPLLILDEPTASLDPMAEVDVYEHIYHSPDVKTLIMVTHRLGGIVQAGRILLLAGGIIAESGSHSDLLQKRGPYSRIFNTQRQWYVRDSSAINEKSVEQGAESNE